MSTWIQSLSPQEWNLRKSQAEQRAENLLSDWMYGRRRGQKQPVLDFLFEYYSFRPAKLRRWTPGASVRIEGEESKIFLQHKHFACVDGGVCLDPSTFKAKRRKGMSWILGMLQAAQQREPYFGCYGMHEWAMVYRTQDVRHGQVPLRMEPDKLASFVDSRPIRCTHYDAFRFFTPKARPLNRLQPTMETMEDLEQPGCLHTNMDLYKWAYKLYPWVETDLILDTFELAIRARHMDMRASPYDLRAHGLEPLPIETPEGRAEYRALQEELAADAAPIRDRLIQSYIHFVDLLAQYPATTEAP